MSTTIFLANSRFFLALTLLRAAAGYSSDTLVHFGVAAARGDAICESLYVLPYRLSLVLLPESSNSVHIGHASSILLFVVVVVPFSQTASSSKFASFKAYYSCIS